MRISIRRLLFVILVLAIAFTWVAERASQQQLAASAILAAGGCVYYQSKPYGDPVVAALTTYEAENSTIQNVFCTVKAIRVEHFFYDEKLQSHIQRLAALETIFVTGNGSDFATLTIREDFPGVRVYDVESLRREDWSRYRWMDVRTTH